MTTDSQTKDEHGNAVQLLTLWQTNAKRSQIANYNAANLYSSRNYKLGIPAVVATTVVGTSVFATLESTVETWVRIIVGLISIIAAILTSLQTFLRYDENAAKHRSAAAEYGSIKREISEHLALDLRKQEDYKDILERLRVRQDELSREAPVMPKKIWEKATRVIPLAKLR